MIVHKKYTSLAVVHAGWRGLQSGVIVNALRNFDHPSSVHVFIGPCISGEAYQVGPEVANYFTTVPGALVPDGTDRSRLDLRQVAIAQLLDHGVTDDHVVVSRQTTDGGETFFSDRAQRPCGRFGLVAKRVIA
jgi:copper oxidase (laccase) domain-containing protein